jgi:uncharacterized CHY-type Zn-finger protein
MIIHNTRVQGIEVDSQTGCVHYRTEKDIIAIQFKCCKKYYPCYQCHDALEEHAIVPWNYTEFGSPAILCGRCGHILTIKTYLNCQAQCTACKALFNQNCQSHYEKYFQIDR